MARGQAERLVPLLDELLLEAALTWSDLNAIGVGIGPGNFTGLRISVATARGLSMSLNIPAIGISSFEILRSGNAETIVLKAPRDRIYVQSFDTNVHAAPPHLGEAAALKSAGSLVPPIRGEGAAAVADRLGMTGDDVIIDNTASAIAELALSRFQEGGPFDRPAPLYVRPPDAAPPSRPAPRIIP